MRFLTHIVMPTCFCSMQAWGMENSFELTQNLNAAKTAMLLFQTSNGHRSFELKDVNINLPTTEEKQTLKSRYKAYVDQKGIVSGLLRTCGAKANRAAQSLQDLQGKFNQTCTSFENQYAALYEKWSETIPAPSEYLSEERDSERDIEK